MHLTELIHFFLINTDVYIGYLMACILRAHKQGALSLFVLHFTHTCMVMGSECCYNVPALNSTCTDIDGALKLLFTSCLLYKQCLEVTSEGVVL